jgi:hypothetical protein
VKLEQIRDGEVEIEVEVAGLNSIHVDVDIRIEIEMRPRLSSRWTPAALRRHVVDQRDLGSLYPVSDANALDVLVREVGEVGHEARVADDLDLWM